MSQDLLASLEYIEKEKGITKEVLLDALKHALISACRKSFPEKGENFDVQIDPHTFSIKMFSEGKEINDPRFGRIAAQTAKQVIIQKIREAERESILTEYASKQGDIVSGTVHRIEAKSIIVDFGKTEGILPAREQSSLDHFRQGNIVRAYVLEVKKTPKGPEVLLSRTHPDLVTQFFDMEVPEIHDGLVKVKGVAREAGSRTKISVTSTDEKIDCVGSCVGVRGQRVKNIVRELGGEKIDIIRYSEDVETYIRNAMAPAELKKVTLKPEKQTAEIVVEDDQLSLAIGKRGQNVRLASKLIGWELDVRSASQIAAMKSLDGIDEKTEEILKSAGISGIKEILRKSVEELTEILGGDKDRAERIILAANESKSKKPEAEAPDGTEEQAAHSEESSEG